MKKKNRKKRSARIFRKDGFEYGYVSKPSQMIGRMEPVFRPHWWAQKISDGTYRIFNTKKKMLDWIKEWDLIANPRRKRRVVRRNRSLRKNEGLGYTSYIPESGFLVAKTTGYHDTPSGKFQLLKKGQVLRILFTTKERRGGGTTGKEYFVAETTDHPYEGMKVLVEKGYAGKIYNSDPRKSSSRYGNRLMGNPRLGKEEKKALDFARKYPNWNGYYPDPATSRVMRSLAKKGLIELSSYPNQFRAIRKNPPMYAHGMMSHRTHGLSLKQMMKLYRLVSSGNPKAVMFARRTLGIPMSESLSQVKAVVYHHILDLKGKI